MNFLKANYKLLRVDGVVKGLCHKDDVSKVTKEMCGVINNFVGKFNRNIGFTIKLSSKRLDEHFSSCMYGAKSKDKVHISYTTGGPGNEDGKVTGIPDLRVVLMTAQEGIAFMKAAEKHEVFFPNNRFIETDNMEMRQVIPKGKILVPDTSGSSGMRYNVEREATTSAFLIKNGVGVVDIA